MSINGGTGDGLELVCPTCEGLLTLPDTDGVSAGDPIRTFCPACERTVEMTAPSGIEAFLEARVDRVDAANVTEFPTETARRR